MTCRRAMGVSPLLCTDPARGGIPFEHCGVVPGILMSPFS